MKNSFIVALQCLSFVALAVAQGEPAMPDQTDKTNPVLHLQEVYKTVDTLKLTLDIFYAKRSFDREKNTAIVFFHGGGWAFGTPSEFFTTCERYAKMGIVTFSVGYRLSAENGATAGRSVSPIECVMDARSSMRWVRENAGKFHLDKNKIVAAGQSAGGQLALSTAMIDGYNERSDDLSVSCRPDAVLLFSSCVNTVEGWCDHLLADRRNTIWSISPTHNIKRGLPPMIEFHGEYDDQVPIWTVQFFESEMKKQGNYMELHIYKGRRHYLGGEDLEYSRYFDDDILKVADEFLRKFHFLE
ncbi:MAG TPA: alpha/beta hydrolase fold domain-containing protein [Bacteroidota bacterium]|nr:alpha/beta hydrolase fold domain-containing protein [Bacteroidota bacterium]